MRILIHPLLVCVLICSVNLCLGQRNGTWIGIECGPNHSWIKGTIGRIPLADQRSRTGMYVGLSVQHHFNNAWSLRTGLAFERKGAAGTTGQFILNEDAPTIEWSDITMNFDYLILPVMMRFTIGDRPGIFLNAGPYGSFLLKQSQQVDMSPDPQGIIIADYWSDRTNSFRRSELGFCAGVGSYLPLSDRIVLSLELRYERGLTNMEPKVRSPFSVIANQPSSHYLANNSLNVLLGFSFRTGPRS